MDRIDLFLRYNIEKNYENTKREQAMVEKVAALYERADAYRKGLEQANPKNLDKWRRAYYGTLNAIDTRTGEESKRRSKPLRKMIYELIESKIDNSIPMPRISPRHKTDLPVVSTTENYLKFEMDRMLTEQANDKSERATYIDGTSWYKICWDSLDNTYERSGDLRVEVLLADQVVPEPGVLDYRQLNYCFERSVMSLSRIYDLYHRHIIPTEPGIATASVITYYYRNKNGVVGRFMFAEATRQVITWDEDWQIRKVRKCTNCGAINPIGDACRVCGGTSFRYANSTTEILEEDIVKLTNPYEEGKSQNPDDNMKEEVFLKAGTEIPFYQVRQLPFVPRLSNSSLDSIYGKSEVAILLDMQDSINKILTKVEEKILKSGAVVTKPNSVKLNDKDETFKILSVRTADEGQMVQLKQIMADVQQDMATAQLIYESARASSGITNSFQGKQDSTAISGKAKELNAAQTAGRLESLRIMKSAAFAGVYELMLKYLLAFSDETRHFGRILPDGTEVEQVWSKYMFLRKDKNGNIYYADDFAFSTDPAATLSNNRVAMWQETTSQFTMGTLGAPNDPRTLELFWRIMDEQQYPLAKYALAGIKANSEHLPPELEQALMENPEVLQAAVALVQETKGGGQGGAREGAGQKGNGATHAANVERTNEKNSTSVENQNDSMQAQLTGGVV